MLEVCFKSKQSEFRRQMFMYLYEFTGGLFWTVCYQRLVSLHFWNHEENLLPLFHTSLADYELFIKCCLYTGLLQAKKTFWSNKLTAWILIRYVFYLFLMIYKCLKYSVNSLYLSSLCQLFLNFRSWWLNNISEEYYDSFTQSSLKTMSVLTNKGKEKLRRQIKQYYHVFLSEVASFP